MFPEHRGTADVHTIRASSKGYIAKEGKRLPRRDEPETAKEDVMTLSFGAAVVYDEPLAERARRSGFLSGPVRQVGSRRHA
jgi:hypothetical protein